MTTNKFSRRDFLRNTLRSSVGVATASATSVGGSLGLMNAALAQSSSRFDDYKALVCVFLFGGNDSLNMLVPTDNADYSVYQNVRQNLAFSQPSLLPLNTRISNTYPVGLPSAMSSLMPFFDSGDLSFVANLGPLLAPVTKQSLINNIQLAPPQLFSHNDQQANWQTSRPDAPSVSGWAGRMADLLTESASALPINLSLFGNNLMQTGLSTSLFSLTPEGTEQFQALTPTQAFNAQRFNVLEQLSATSSHVLEQGYIQKVSRAMTNNVLIDDALTSSAQNANGYPESNPLAAQLATVARLISVEQRFTQRRQVYFVGLGGWDTHDRQVDTHPRQLQLLSEALSAFQTNLNQLNIADAVTTFTMSEFGRTLTSNGDGTDHGWGGHQLVMGGAVNGGNIVGNLPELALGSNDDLDDGRIIPTTSVDEYIASLARWFGLSDSELNTVLPNLNRFNSASLSIFN